MILVTPSCMGTSMGLLRLHLWRSMGRRPTPRCRALLMRRGWLNTRASSATSTQRCPERCLDRWLMRWHRSEFGRNCRRCTRLNLGRGWYIFAANYCRHIKEKISPMLCILPSWKSYADEMAIVGKRLDDDDIVSYILSGLDAEYNPIVEFVLRRPSPQHWVIYMPRLHRSSWL
jgi:hypothetical protein